MVVKTRVMAKGGGVRSRMRSLGQNYISRSFERVVDGLV